MVAASAVVVARNRLRPRECAEGFPSFMWPFDLSRIPRVVTEPEMGVKQPEYCKIACTALRATPAGTNGEVLPSGARDFQYNSLPEGSLGANSIPAVRPTRRVL